MTTVNCQKLAAYAYCWPCQTLWMGHSSIAIKPHRFMYGYNVECAIVYVCVAVFISSQSGTQRRAQEEGSLPHRALGSPTTLRHFCVQQQQHALILSNFANTSIYLSRYLEFAPRSKASQIQNRARDTLASPNSPERH